MSDTPAADWNPDPANSARGSHMLYINTSDLMDVSWTFLGDVWRRPGDHWVTHSGMPSNALERTIRRPDLARYRAASAAARQAASATDTILVSHLPRMSAATNVARRLACSHVGQVAFAFNFTDLPTGALLSYFRRSLQGIDEFVVFSSYERSLYPKLLEMDPDRFHHLSWAMETPVPAETNPLRPRRPYVCAVGGEGRDYVTLAEAARRRPGVDVVVVARKRSVADVRFPSNVTVLVDSSFADTWKIACDSIGMIIPLRDERTACGHITIVGAQRLRVPLIVTRSAGVDDYVRHGETAWLVSAGDVSDLCDGIDRVVSERSWAKRLADAARAESLARSDFGVWVDHLEQATTRLCARR